MNKNRIVFEVKKMMGVGNKEDFGFCSKTAGKPLDNSENRSYIM